jgi:hypothetical protein
MFADPLGTQSQSTLADLKLSGEPLSILDFLAPLRPVIPEDQLPGFRGKLLETLVQTAKSLFPIVDRSRPGASIGQRLHVPG